MANLSDVKMSIREHPSAWLLAFTLAAGCIYLWWTSRWGFGAVTFNVNQNNILGYLTPLLVTAALIERAVEVAISPWRDPDADKKSSTVKAARKLAEANAADPAASQNLTNVTNDFHEYTGKTRRYAYAIAVALSVFAVVAGIRTLAPMLGPDAATHPPVFPGNGGQRYYFDLYDQVLTTLLLAGGAAGLHAPINGITSFFAQSKT